MGASELGWECCRVLLDQGQQVMGIFSIPQDFKISWAPEGVHNVRFKNFEDLARQYDVPLTWITKKMSDADYLEAAKAMQPDLCVVIGWYYLIPQTLLKLAPKGTIGIHASLLPRYRGGAPLVWAMIRGETQTGVSLFYLADGVDNGDIIGQQSFPIDTADSISDVIGKATASSIHLLNEYIPALAAGSAPRQKQNEKDATVVPQRKPEDGLLDWKTKTAAEAHNWVRAQSRPYPGAFAHLAGQKVTLWKARLSPVKTSGQPGEIAAGAGLGIHCADGKVLDILEVGLEDGRALSGTDFMKHTGRTRS